LSGGEPANGLFYGFFPSDNESNEKIRKKEIRKGNGMPGIVYGVFKCPLSDFVVRLPSDRQTARSTRTVTLRVILWR